VGPRRPSPTLQRGWTGLILGSDYAQPPPEVAPAAPEAPSHPSEAYSYAQQAPPVGGRPREK